MKGGTGLPITLLVAIVIAVIVIVAALFITGIIPGLEETKVFEGYFLSCCTSYNLAGHCGEGQANYEFECIVSSDVVPEGKMQIWELAGKTGRSVESCCG